MVRASRSDELRWVARASHFARNVRVRERACCDAEEAEGGTTKVKGKRDPEATKLIAETKAAMQRVRDALAGYLRHERAVDRRVKRSKIGPRGKAR
jgi:hypothetical protein